MEQLKHIDQLKITVSDAARIMGKSEIFIREAMKRELFPFGFAVETGGETRKWNFFIGPKEFADYMCISGDELWRRVFALKKTGGKVNESEN